jgi:cysteine-rich repeat protein
MRRSLLALALVVGLRAAAVAVCGDGILDLPDEQCDDGNTVDGDCCSATCQFENPGSPCADDGNPCTVDACDGAGTCAHAAGNGGAVCRPAAGDCDVAETCTGSDPSCPPDSAQPDGTGCDDHDACTRVDACQSGTCVGSDHVTCVARDVCHAVGTCDPATGTCTDPTQPDGTECDDGNACTRNDTCQGGVCTGTDPVVCSPADACHLASVCDPASGACSSTTKPDATPCDDGNACTTADTCQAGTCRGLPVAGCCLRDADCDDAVACTTDRCVAKACVHAPVDDRCGASTDCAQPMCSPSDPAADTSGCVARPLGDGGFCGEDGDPCTVDACHGGVCGHTPDGSGTTCALLTAPYRTALQLTARTLASEGALEAALAGCPAGRGAACDLVPGDESSRLVSLLESARLDFETATLAIAGRLAGPSLDPSARARLAMGVLAPTPGKLRSFAATLTDARHRGTVGRVFARQRRGDAARLLAGAARVRRELHRVTIRRGSFAR